MAELAKTDGTFRGFSEPEPFKALSDEKAQALLEMLKAETSVSLTALGVLKSVINWRKTKCGSCQHDVYAINGDISNGSFVSIFRGPKALQLNFYSQLPDDPKLLDALQKTSLIDWTCSKLDCFLNGIPEQFLPIIEQLIKREDVDIVVYPKGFQFWMELKDALSIQVECPPEAKIDNLTPNHAEFINHYWPFKYEGSEGYFKILLEQNSGLGVFVPNEVNPVAWVLCGLNYKLNHLYTIDKYPRKGYARLIILAMAKKLAEIGVNPVADVMITNEPSKGLFSSIGFNKSSYSHYIDFQRK